MQTPRSLLQLIALMGFMLPAIDAWTGIMEIPPDPEFPGQCVDPETGLPHAVGSEWPASHCTQNTCHKEEEGNFTISMVGCITEEYDIRDRSCRVVEDLEADYPDCCEKIVCDEPVAPARDISASRRRSGSVRRRSGKMARLPGSGSVHSRSGEMGPTIVGGIHKVETLNEHHQKIVDFGMAQLAGAPGGCNNKLVRVENFGQQVVAGRLYHFDLVRQCDGEAESVCHMKVVDVPWRGGKEVLWDRTTCE